MSAGDLAVVEKTFFDEAGVRVTNLGILKDVQSVAIERVERATIEEARESAGLPLPLIVSAIVLDMMVWSALRRSREVFILFMVFELGILFTLGVLRTRKLYNVLAQTADGTFFLCRTNQRESAERLAVAIEGAIMENAARQRTPESPYRS